MATNNSGLNSNYLLVSEERRERERRERERARINRRRASEDDRQRERVRDRQRRRNSSEERHETERVRARENRRRRRERELQVQRERQPNSSISTEGEWAYLNHQNRFVIVHARTVCPWPVNCLGNRQNQMLSRKCLFWYEMLNENVWLSKPMKSKVEMLFQDDDGRKCMFV